MIWKVPFSIRLIRPSFPRILCPSFSHWMLGMGLPMMWQCNWVVEPGAKVWLAGPWRMMGGMRSEGAVGRTDSGHLLNFEGDPRSPCDCSRPEMWSWSALTVISIVVFNGFSRKLNYFPLKQNSGPKKPQISLTTALIIDQMQALRAAQSCAASSEPTECWSEQTSRLMQNPQHPVSTQTIHQESSRISIFDFYIWFYIFLWLSISYLVCCHRPGSYIYRETQSHCSLFWATNVHVRTQPVLPRENVKCHQKRTSTPRGASQKSTSLRSCPSSTCKSMT